MLLTWFIVITLDPLGRPTITAGGGHYFHTCRPSICPHFAQNNFWVRIVFAIGGIVGLAEGIIDGTCLV